MKAPRKRTSPHSAAPEGPAELVFVVDVSSLTDQGFTGATSYGGGRVEFEFDDKDGGLSLTSEMAARLRVRRGSRVLIVIEDGSDRVAEETVASVGEALRISSAKVYNAVGREGGAVLRLRKA